MIAELRLSPGTHADSRETLEADYKSASGEKADFLCGR